MPMRNYGTPAWLEVASRILRRKIMEKYGVEIDPKKVDQQKDKKQGEKTAGANDPNVNVPKDPDKGTEPFEKRPEDD